MKTDKSQSNKLFKDTVLEKIESEQVCPRSRWSFLCHECIVWCFWVLSVIVGSLAVAVTAFVMSHHQYAIYEATHDNFLTFMFEVLPYIWIILFSLMVYFSFYNLRHTKRGYRYPVSYILVSSVILSLAGGSALQLFGFGYTIDNTLGRHVPMYVSQDKLEKRLWQDPKEGRLIGKQVLSTVAPTSSVIFEDIKGVRWTVNVQELFARELELLITQQQVRLLGLQNSETTNFHACGVFPWMIGEKVKSDDMYKEREAFAEKVYIQTKKAKERLRLLEEETFSPNKEQKTDICANLAVMRRMPPPNHE